MRGAEVGQHGSQCVVDGQDVRGGAAGDDLERPDRLVFDLDPDEGAPWAHVAEGARAIHAALDDLGLRGFVKATGGKDLHVVLPVEPHAGWETDKAFARDVAARLAAAALEAELTLPGLTQSVVLTRTSGRASAMPDAEALPAFAGTGATLAIHLSIHLLDKVVAELTPAYGADCPVAIVWRASWPDERIVRATLATIVAAAADGPERTALILVGRVLAPGDFGESSLYAADYDRRFRPTTPQSRFAGSET